MTENKTVFKPLRLTADDWRQIQAAMARHGYDNWAQFARDAIRYFIKEADRSRGDFTN